MSWLLDTNVLSELRKQDRASPQVMAWFDAVHDADLFTSVLVLGEIRRGIASIRRRDPSAANALDAWLGRMQTAFHDRVLPVTSGVCDRWGRLNVPDPVPTVDGLLAATALEHGMTLVTRSTRDVLRTGVPVLNPFDFGG